MRLDLAAVPPEALSSALEQHEDYRVLRRIVPMRRSGAASLAADMLIGCAVSIATTGPDHGRDAVSELTMQRFWADASGRLAVLGRIQHWTESPATASPPIGPAAAKGPGGIWEPMAAGLMIDADFVVTHDARRCRPFVEARLPIAKGRPWVCTLNDVDWDEVGAEGRSLSDLVVRIGRFHERDGTSTDVDALLHLMDHPLRDGGTVLRTAVDAASRATWLIEATGAPYAAEERLRLRGYSWNAGARLWSTEVSDDDLQAELQWATIHVYGGRARPTHRRVTWTERYAAD